MAPWSCFAFFISSFVASGSILAQCSDERFFLLVIGFCFTESLLVCLDKWMDSGLYLFFSLRTLHGRLLQSLCPHKFVSFLVCAYLQPREQMQRS